MKKVLLLILLGFSSSVFSQKGTFKINALAGLNSAFPVGPDAKQDKIDMEKAKKEYESRDGGIYSGSLRPRLGFHLGATINYNISDKLSVRSGLIYSQRGYNTKIESKYNAKAVWGTKYEEIFNKSTVVKLNYIDMPIGIQYLITPSIFINAGPCFSFIISESSITKWEYTFARYSNGQDIIDFITEEKIESTNAKSVLLGFQAGLGLTKNRFGGYLGIIKSGQPQTALGVSYGYPTLLLQCGLSYNLFTKNK